jgi:opacity protein-like surface antigen
VKRTCRCFFLFSLLLMLFCIPALAARGSATVGLGFGTNHVIASGLGINSYTGSGCVPGEATSVGTCDATPGLNGFNMGVSGDGMPWEHFGIGFEIVFLPAKGTWGPLEFRQTFYDFNGIYEPFTKGRTSLKLLGGIGGSRTSSSFKSQTCVGSFCSSESIAWATENHFQLHAGAGVEIYVTDHVFVRPQYDFRYVTNFTELFGRKTVQGGMIWIGFGTGNK